MFLGVTLSGCLVAESAPTNNQTQAAPEAAEPAAFDETTGAISGLVVSDEGLPVAGALAGIRETGAQTISDVGGVFTFSNVPPGDYTMDVSQLGYESASKRITVNTGQVSHVNFGLRSIAVEGPWYETMQDNGNVWCSVRVYPGAPTTGAAGAPPWTTGVAICGGREVQGVGADRFLIGWEVPSGTIELLVELIWTSTQATGTALGFSTELDGRANNPDYSFPQQKGRAPLIMYANETLMAERAETSGISCLEDGCPFITRVFAEAETTGIQTPVPLGPFPDPLGDPQDRVDFGITLDQRYTFFITHFHGEPKPEGFSALADG